MYSFGESSTRILLMAHDQIQAVCNESIKYYDSSVVDTYREQEDQDHYFKVGLSKVKWPGSKHNNRKNLPDGTYEPYAKAVDLYPWHPIYGSLTTHKDCVSEVVRLAGVGRARALAFITEEYCMQAMSVLIAAQKLGIKIRWGGDWARSGKRLKNKFDDLAHFELV